MAAAAGLGHTGVPTQEEARATCTALHTRLGAVLWGLLVNTGGRTAGHAGVIVAVGRTLQGCNGKGKFRTSKTSTMECLEGRERSKTHIGHRFRDEGVAHFPF